MSGGQRPAEHGELDPGIADRIDPRPDSACETVFEGHVWDVTRETFALDGNELTREVVRHPGAVAVVALRGEPGAEQVLLIEQYRHPVGAFEWELPAGLLDVEGEPAQRAAARELAEEADLVADRWHVLLDVFTSSGALSENVRIFLARDVRMAEQAFDREDEEADMPTGWLGLDEALAAIQDGRVHNALATNGVMATVLARQADWATLRPADSPWPQHPAFR